MNRTKFYFSLMFLFIIYPFFWKKWWEYSSDYMLFANVSIVYYWESQHIECVLRKICFHFYERLAVQILKNTISQGYLSMITVI